jgi:predicted membrane metal-binding protein
MASRLISVSNPNAWIAITRPRLTLISTSYYLCFLLSLFLIISVSYYLCFLLSLFLIISVSYYLCFLFRTSTGANPNAWIAITLPESILIRRVKAFPYEVIEENQNKFINFFCQQ